MKYGFVIDNRKCIGCHACTTACKSEHQVPIGVNRTWVKQVEKGEFPHTRRLFSVMRCNHCTDAPCVEICPTEALHFRNDGIVDFDKERCIGCKSCMQACPYDALYIDPETKTAAKCNYCAHRIDVGLEPACVNVCPEHAIISGDMDNPNSEISALLSRQAVKVRKSEKGTKPNLFYIDADDVSLIPTSTAKTGEYLWSQQSLGVGHYAKEAEKLAFSNDDVIDALNQINHQYNTSEEIGTKAPKTIELVMGKEARRVYDTPDKGILWGWEVSGYVFTKAIASGALLVLLLAKIFGLAEPAVETEWWSYGLGILFLSITGILLVMDLDQPKRFLYVLLRPHWTSWLVRGGYTITLFGGLVVLLSAMLFFNFTFIKPVINWITMFTAVLLAIYTAFLFGQAKGRDFWQSPGLALHMLIHSFMAGAAVFAILGLFNHDGLEWTNYIRVLALLTIGLNLVTLCFELVSKHPTEDAKHVVNMITKGRYAGLFYTMVLFVGNILPFILLNINNGNKLLLGIAGITMLIGIFFTEKIWVEAPQRIPLS